MIEVRAVRGKKDIETFLHVPWKLGMKDDPNWVPPLLDDYRRQLDPKKSPFLEHGEIQCFLARVAGTAVGRISVQIDRIFDQLRSDQGGTPVSAAEAARVKTASCGGTDRDGQVSCAVFVLGNLLANALRHTPAGGTVRVAVRRAGDRVELTVTDTGAGIPADLLPHVFDRFVKGPGATGTGLGLAIARDVVAAHGGTIGIESEPGAGTTVRVELPAAP